VYREHYQKQRLHGAYLILDNSAHEYKEGINAAKLLRQAMRVRAQEIVVPDVLDDGPATVERAMQALEEWYEGDSAEDMHELNPCLMYVPQGKDKEEYWLCIQELIDLHLYIAQRKNSRRDIVIGVSKDYQDLDGGLLEILDIVKDLRENLWADKEIRMHCHLLGWSRNLWVYGEIAKKHSWIRSTDSCKPFQYAMHGMKLWPSEEPPPYPKRHRTDFHKAVLDKKQLKIAGHNCRVFAQAAAGKL